MLDKKSPTFRDDLKAARKARHLSGAALSTAIGISPGMISRYESYNRNDGVLPGEETLEKINAILFPTESATEKPATHAIVHTAIFEKTEQEVADGLPLPVLIKAIKKHGAKEIVF